MADLVFLSASGQFRSRFVECCCGDARPLTKYLLIEMVMPDAANPFGAENVY